MGILKEPKQSEEGMAGKPSPTFFDRIIKWKNQKPKKGKLRKAFEKESMKGMKSFSRGLKKFIKDVENT